MDQPLKLANTKHLLDVRDTHTRTQSQLSVSHTQVWAPALLGPVLVSRVRVKLICGQGKIPAAKPHGYKAADLALLKGHTQTHTSL